MQAKNSLLVSLYQLQQHNKHGSFQTQKKREIELNQMANDLAVGGYKLEHAYSLKEKHIDHLNKKWMASGLAPATIKNKNSQLRWWANTIKKGTIMKSNAELGVPKRDYKPKRNKAIHLTSANLEKVNDKYIEASLGLQYHLGLRKEESIKIRPHAADKGDYLELQRSWCKGGRARKVPILTPEARAAVDFAKSVVKQKQESLIPNRKNYKMQKHFYEHKTVIGDLKCPHGLRHAYAQQRYKTLTGWECPINGGKPQKDLSREERCIDNEARLTISEELGHSRPEILRTYCG